MTKTKLSKRARGPVSGFDKRESRSRKNFAGVKPKGLYQVTKELREVNRAADDFFRRRGLPIPHVSKTHLEFVEGISDHA
jgi:hypothetical protein